MAPLPGRAMWAAGWLDWSSSGQNTNLALIREERYAKLAPYFQSDDQNIHKCTLDRFLSRQQSTVRFRERVRSVAMNATVGDGNAQVGPWDSIYAQARRQYELIYPGPEGTFVFIEEHPDSINDPMLYPPRQNQWVDLPSGLHANGGVAGFADGRAELHVWRRTLRNLRVRYSILTPTARTGDPDISWVSYHSNHGQNEVTDGAAGGAD